MYRALKKGPGKSWRTPSANADLRPEQKRAPYLPLHTRRPSIDPHFSSTEGMRSDERKPSAASKRPRALFQVPAALLCRLVRYRVKKHPVSIPEETPLF